jgi:phosphotransferase system enzyme I (PtsI)
LRFIRDTVTAAHKNGIWVGVCGEMPGSVYGALLLLGLELDEFSASAYLIPEIKKIIRSVTLDETKVLVKKALKLPTAGDVKQLLNIYIENKRPELGEFVPEAVK